jgi:hypothetical protein
MIRLSSFFMMCSFVLLSSIVQGEEEIKFSYPPKVGLEKVEAYVDAVPKTHPRLFADEETFDRLRKSLKESPAKWALAEAVMKRAEKLMDAAPIERKLQGRRLLGKSRECVHRVLVLAMSYQLTGDEKYAERAEKEMLAAAAFSDWNPSHFLDVGEMTFALAVGYDWLYHVLPSESRKTIREAIVKKGVILPFETRHKGWVRATNNWGQVCHGGLTAGALAVMEDYPELAAKTVHNALENVPRSMNAYAPKGSYPEGPGYWGYGTSYNVVLIAELESVFGTSFGLTQAPGFSETGQYMPLVTGPSERTFNYADGGAGRGPEMALFWFAKRYDRPDWLLGERRRLIERVRSSSMDRLLPLALFWIEPKKEDIEIEMPRFWQSGGHVPIAVLRSSWTDPDATFVGIKAGSPRANHGQMDIGSFVLDALGERWAKDLGAEGYHGIESRGMNLWNSRQDSDRWTIFRQMNHGHNTLVIDDQLQRAAGHAEIVSFSDDPENAHATVDMTEVYKDQVDSAKRTVRLLPSGEVALTDQLTGLEPGAKVRWGMITPAEAGKPGQKEMLLKQDGKSMRLAIQSPEEATWKIIDTATPRNEWDSPNRGTRMAAFEVTAPEDGKLELEVIADPIEK